MGHRLIVGSSHCHHTVCTHVHYVKSNNHGVRILDLIRIANSVQIKATLGVNLLEDVAVDTEIMKFFLNVFLQYELRANTSLIQHFLNIWVVKVLL